MSSAFTLDSLRDETRKKYAPVKIGLSDGSEVELKSLLRLGKKSRDQVIDMVDDLKSFDDPDSEDDDLSADEAELFCDSIGGILKVITTSADQLIAELDDPDYMIKVALMTEVLNRWLGATQLGEAGNSPA